MTQLEIEAALDAAFRQCELFSCPLSSQQKQILLQAVQEFTQNQPEANNHGNAGKAGCNGQADNPLNPLTVEERQALLTFIQREESENRSWKTTLLNDWVQERDSGSVQFIRDRYGVQWLEQVKPFHLAQYADDQRELIRLKVGDRIEVTNGLWEWVQEDGPCSREWFPCTVIDVREPPNPAESETGEDPVAETGFNDASCIVRFDTGAEYEIQGVYDWNRPNWRWIDEN